MPGLAIMLSLRHTKLLSDSLITQNDEKHNTELSSVVLFVCGLLLGNDQDVKMWIAQHIKLSQKVCC